MKHLLLQLLFIATIGNTKAQRLVPVFESGYPVDNLDHGPNNSIYDLESHNGNLYFSGEFSECNTIAASKIARWNGNNFYPVETIPGIMGAHKIYKLKSFDGLLYAAGNMPSLNNILSYDGADWAQVAEGLNGTILDIEIFNNQLYVCGEFTSSGNTILNHIAVLTNDGWISVGNGFNGDVYDLEIYEGSLYAAGEFTQSSDGLSSLNYLSKLNNNVWINSELNSNGPVFTLLNKDDRLIIGGDFGNILNGAVVTDRIAKFDGNNFEGFESITAYLGTAPVVEILDADKGYYVTTGNTVFGPGTMFSAQFYNDSTIKIFPAGPVRVSHIHEDQFFIGMADNGTLKEPMDNFMYKVLEGTYIAQADNGNIHFSCAPTPTHFHFDDIKTGFEMGNGTQLSTVFAASPWIYGNTSDDQLYIAAQTYESDELRAWYFGPYSAVYNREYAEKYMRSWEITKTQIEEHLANYGNPQYTIPEAFLSWPANGNTQMNEAANLAAYVDFDGDNNYIPQNGDYADIRGDHAIYFILRDKSGFITDDFKPGIELHVLMYAYEHPSESVNNTVFVNYRMINRSSRNYDECKLGFWTDFDIGNASDDYVGCDSTRNLFFGYNGSDFDAATVFSPGFGYNLPAQGVKFLNTELSSFMYYVNSSNPIYGEPNNGVHFYNYMNGKFKDGSWIMFGQNFGNMSDTYHTGFMYPSCPFSNPEPVWNEGSMNNPVGDRRGIGASSGFQLLSNEEKCVDIALITAFKSEELPFEEVHQLKLSADSILTFYQLMDFECYESLETVGISESKPIPESASVYPNPGNGIYHINPGNSEFRFARLFDISGKEIMQFDLLKERTVIDLSSHYPGIYLLQLINSEKRKTYTLKLIHSSF